MRGSSSTPRSAFRTTSSTVVIALALAAGGFSAIAPVSAAARPTSPAVRAPHAGPVASSRSLHSGDFRISGRNAAPAPATNLRHALSPSPLAPSSCNSTWSAVPSPNGSGDNFLSATASTSASDVWAVGNWTSGSGSSAVDRTLAEHWNGNAWAIKATGNIGSYTNDLNAVAALSPTNAWAVGEYTDHFVSNGTTYDIFQNLIEHWDGTSWTILPSVNANNPMFSEVDNVLLGITALGANDIWAVGTWYTGTVDNALALHYNGTSWSVASLPVNAGLGDNELFGVSGTSGSDVWATGFFRATGSGSPPSGNGSPRQTLTDHWNGVAWSVVTSPSVNANGDSNLYAVAALSATNAWAAGYGRASNTVARQTLIEHYDGTAWTTTTSTDPGGGDNVLFGMAMLGTSNGWAVGYQVADTNSTTPAQTLTEQWNGTSWSTVASANSGPVNNELFAATGISASDVWAAGFAASAVAPDQTLTENFCAPPTVTGISPTKGPTSGGTSVTITGTGFVLASGVMFGGFAANGFTINSDTQITAQSPAEVAGTVDVKVSYFGGTSATSSADQFTFIPLYVFSPQPIAPNATLAANQSVPVMLTAKSFDGTPDGGATIYLSFTASGGGATAVVGATLLNTIPTAFTADSNGNITITYTTPLVLPTVGTDTIVAQDAPTGSVVSAQDTYTYSKVTTFYFAEGFTGSGFTETLSMLLPNQSGTANIDYYTEAGHQPTVVVALTAGQVHVEDVNADVGGGHQVSAVVSLPGPGVAERALHFNNGTWHGSTDKVGVTAPATEWDFAEGSTLTIFNEFLSLQNPNPYAVVVDLNYATDSGAHPTRTLVLPANSRTTVVAFSGSLAVVPPPLLNYGGCDPLHTCGVGTGVVGVSVQVKSRTLPIVAERPFYVMNYSFGYGQIRDGHDAFGANAPAMAWNFAEGTTLNGFNEYLTIQNPGSVAANVRLHYIYDLGTKDVNLVVNAKSRQTALVFDATHFGIGRPYVGVSVVITSDQPIVAERPMYIYYNFGTGPVAGAHVVVGATSLAKVFGFANASTATGDNDYMTIQNSNSVTANVTITYYVPTGPPVVKNLAIPANTRHTVLVFGTTEGVGGGVSPLGIVVSSDQSVQVEKPTYSSNSSTYGATDTPGYTPPTGAF